MILTGLPPFNLTFKSFGDDQFLPENMFFIDRNTIIFNLDYVASVQIMNILPDYACVAVHLTNGVCILKEFNLYLLGITERQSKTTSSP